MITEQERKRKKLFGKKRVYGIREGEKLQKFSVFYRIQKFKEKNN